MRASEVGALVESFRHEVRIVAEGVAANTEAIAGLRADVDRLTGEQETLKLQVAGLTHRVERLESEVGNLRGEVAVLRGEVTGLRAEFREFRLTMERLILNHEGRIAALEKNRN